MSIMSTQLRRPQPPGRQRSLVLLQRLCFSLQPHLDPLRSFVVDHESFAAMSRRLGRAIVSLSHAHAGRVYSQHDEEQNLKISYETPQIHLFILELFPLCHDVRDTLIFQSRAV